ncbi:hypothetical protein GCM10010520_11320 [Rhizobium viscosum]|uniref:Uncharacterized protein n=1 Tax=Rhizobium viscosum TaxID=1673 RepID=A0ABR9IYL8_RHIVS|nr:hypothetical protein [Rhizobium viscosum]MBE1508318.1 hypothetical protein [Rhizobium viscosum]
MIYNEPKPSGFAFPLILILVAMAIMVGGLAMTAGHTPATRVWVPASSAGL